jgi:hypothetical protein
MSRLAGKVIQINIDRFSIELSKVSPKEVAIEQLVRQMQRDCPECIGCAETKFHEQDDHMRMAKLFAITCKQPVRNNGDMVRCPDGFFGMYDASAKEVRQVKLEVPTLTTSLEDFDPSAAIPAPRWVTVGADKGTFEREFMTRPMLEEESDGIGKISAGLASFGPGSTTGYTRSDACLNPNTFNADRPAGVKAAPKVNRDAPVTADGDAW